jgi:phage repressor protein C with HTH and peptisase S24 domain
LIDIDPAEADAPGNLVELAKQGVHLSHDYLKSNGISIDSAKCIRVVGNSMEPRLSDGDIVGINTDDRRIRDGKAYGVRHGDLLRVKFLIEQPDGGVIVRSMNRDEFQDELLTKQQKTEELTVLGRVFCSFSTW